MEKHYLNLMSSGWERNSKHPETQQFLPLLYCFSPKRPCLEVFIVHAPTLHWGILGRLSTTELTLDLIYIFLIYMCDICVPDHVCAHVRLCMCGDLCVHVWVWRLTSAVLFNCFPCF